jgi:hypothetical protein
MAYLGGVFTQHKRDEKGHPRRDYDSTTYVSTFNPIDQFGPLLRLNLRLLLGALLLGCAAVEV